MSALLSLLVFVAAFLATAAATRRLIPYLTRAAVIDIPNARSLHAAPVPRGGGLAIVAVVLLTHVALLLTGGWSDRAALITLAVAAGFAALGWADDRASRSAGLRFALQAILGAVFVLGALPAALDWPTRALLWLAVMWAVNLFNFMDGADGLAGTQALIASAGLGVLLMLGGAHDIALLAFALAGAAAGFLRWNWHPARIFLGDAGSYFIGFELAALVLLSARDNANPWPGLILVAPFVIDATLTLLARALRGVPVWRAHREHAYQALVLHGWSPARVSRALSVLLVVLCVPAAALARAHAVMPALFAYGLLAIIWLWVRRSMPSRR